jgi:uncharacterized protein YdhG (YjbR/CyaY superfamily)
MANTTGPDDVTAYLQRQPPAIGTALQSLRDQLRALLPEATERISYQLPTFVVGHGVVAFGARKDGCSLYPMSSAAADAIRADVTAAGLTMKGTTVHFAPDQPLPESVLRRLVDLRLAENAERYDS